MIAISLVFVICAFAQINKINDGLYEVIAGETVISSTTSFYAPSAIGFRCKADTTVDLTVTVTGEGWMGMTPAVDVVIGTAYQWGLYADPTQTNTGNFDLLVNGATSNVNIQKQYIDRPTTDDFYIIVDNSARFAAVAPSFSKVTLNWSIRNYVDKSTLQVTTNVGVPRCPDSKLKPFNFDCHHSTRHHIANDFFGLPMSIVGTVPCKAGCTYTCAGKPCKIEIVGPTDQIVCGTMLIDPSGGQYPCVQSKCDASTVANCAQLNLKASCNCDKAGNVIQKVCGTNPGTIQTETYYVPTGSSVTQQPPQPQPITNTNGQTISYTNGQVVTNPNGQTVLDTKGVPVTYTNGQATDTKGQPVTDTKGMPVFTNTPPQSQYTPPIDYAPSGNTNQFPNTGQTTYSNKPGGCLSGVCDASQMVKCQPGQTSICICGGGGLSVLSKMCQGQPSNMNANGGGGCSQSTQDMCASLLDCAKGTRADCQCGANGEISGASCLTATSNESSPPSSASASQLTILYTTIFLCVIAAIFV